jgi:hypothetical protein
VTHAHSLKLRQPDVSIVEDSSAILRSTWTAVSCEQHIKYCHGRQRRLFSIAVIVSSNSVRVL